MKYNDLPERWKKKIDEYLTKMGKVQFKQLSAYDFPQNKSIKMTFPDGSKVLFHYAFTIEAPEFQEIGVFTEHCGYHLFPLNEAITLTEAESG